MILNRIIIYLFVTSLLGSNMLWAGEGQLDNFFNSDTHVSVDIDGDGDVMHHVVDKHHDGHDCHMSAHLVGLSSQALSLVDMDSVNALSTYNIHFSTQELPPPYKPPQA